MLVFEQYGLARAEWERRRVRAIQKLVKQGNSAMVTIPRWVLEKWKVRVGDLLFVELSDTGVVTLTQFQNPDGLQGPSPGVVVDPPSGKM